MLPSPPPESEFFRAILYKDFHSIVLPCFFSWAVSLWNCVNLLFWIIV